MPSRVFLPMAVPMVACTFLMLTLIFAGAAAAQETTTADPAATADATSDATAETTTVEDANREGSFQCESFLRVVRDENGALRRQYRDGDDEVVAQRFEQCLEGDILRDTIPNRLLPDTGGPSLLGFAGITLAALVAGASVFGAARRRR